MRDTHIDNIDTLLTSIESNPKIQQQFINSFTTNKTDFFREDFHFQDMIDRALPLLFKRNKPIKIYCCASSTGQEPYSIAMSVLYAKKLYGASTPVSIIATDIDTDVLQEAKEGIYTQIGLKWRNILPHLMMVKTQMCDYSKPKINSNQ